MSRTNLVMTHPAATASATRVGTEEDPLVHPVTGERLVFRRRAADTQGELLEFIIRMAPGGFIWWNPSDAEAATLIQLRPAFDMETLFETMFGLAADGRVNKRGMPNPLQMLVLARAYRREVTPPPPMSWVIGPLSTALAPLGRRLGYQARYDKYSGPAPGAR